MLKPPWFDLNKSFHFLGGTVLFLSSSSICMLPEFCPFITRDTSLFTLMLEESFTTVYILAPCCLLGLVIVLRHFVRTYISTILSFAGIDGETTTPKIQ